MRPGTIFRLKHRTYDSDRYEHTFRVDGDDYLALVWESDVFAGPGVYNQNHVDYLVDNDRLSVGSVMEMNNPYYLRLGLRKDSAKFRPRIEND